MKKYVLSALIGAAALTACDSYTDIHQEYLEGGEITYLQKIDSIATYAGYNRMGVKLWYNNGDRLNKTIIYYANYQDSIVIDLTGKLESGKSSLELTVDLDEGNYNFEVVNYNVFQQKSLATSHFASSYGKSYRETLKNRLLKGSRSLFNNEGFEVEWYSPAEGYTKVELEYNSTTGKKTILVDTESIITIDEYPTDSKFKYRTYYQPEEEAIDEFPSAWSDEIELTPMSTD